MHHIMLVGLLLFGFFASSEASTITGTTLKPIAAGQPMTNRQITTITRA